MLSYIYIYIYIYIYLCKKHCHLLCWIYKKNNFFSLFTPHFSFKKIHKHPACKIGRDKQRGADRKFEFLREHTFWRLQSLFAATKIYVLFFNLTHSLTSLMGLFHFLQWKIFSSIHWQILKILGNGVFQSVILSLKCDHPLLCEFLILFSTEKIKLGHKFSQLIDSTFGFWNISLGLRIFPSFSQFIKEMGNWDFWKA